MARASKTRETSNAAVDVGRSGGSSISSVVRVVGELERRDASSELCLHFLQFRGRSYSVMRYASK